MFVGIFKSHLLHLAYGVWDMRELCCCAITPVNAGIAVMCKAMINVLSSRCY